MLTYREDDPQPRAGTPGGKQAVGVPVEIPFWLENRMHILRDGRSLSIAEKKTGGQKRLEADRTVADLVTEYAENLMRRAKAGQEFVVLSTGGFARVDSSMKVAELAGILEYTLPEGDPSPTYEVELLTANVPTKGGRVYSKEALEGSLAAVADVVRNGLMFGELRRRGDPPRSVESCVAVRRDRLALALKSYRWSGDVLLGKIQPLMNTECGIELRGILGEPEEDADERPERGFYMALRGFGSVVDVGGNLTVLPGFTITAWDAILED